MIALRARFPWLRVLPLPVAIASLGTVLWPAALTAQAPFGWVEHPAGWTATPLPAVMVLSPNDLGQGTLFRVLVEPPARSELELAADYAQALTDLGAWTAQGAPANRELGDGWTSRSGDGTVQLDTGVFRARTVVARRGADRVRFWVLADSDATFARYRGALDTIVASARKIGRAAAPFAPHPLPAGFGKGLSGVYVGIERGLSASAGVGAGLQQRLDPATGRIETSPGSGPQVQTQIGDSEEVDVLYPDGTYRRRLPLRGLAGDPEWERARQSILWGTWKREGNRVVVRRGSYATAYTIEADGHLTSERGRPWVKVAAHDDARLEGSFARHDLRDPDAPRLVLHADGRYEDRGGFLRMVGTDWNLVVPDGDSESGGWSEPQRQQMLGPGSGTYQLGAYTLTLRGTDGRVWQLPTYLPPGESLPRAQRLVVAGRQLVRD